MNSGISRNSTFAMCVYYVPIGAVSALANFLNLAMFMHSREARRTYAIFIALEFGQLINSASFILTGGGRLMSMGIGTFYTQTTVHDCFFRRYWVHTQILGTEIPTIFLILSSSERICAVCWPDKYNKMFTKHNKWLMIAASFVLALASLAAAGISAYNNLAKNNSGHCGIIHSSASWYPAFHFIFVIAGFTASLLSLIVMKVYSMKFRISGNKKNRRDTQTNILIALACASLVFVATPSLVQIGLRYSWFVMEDMWVGLMYSMTVMISIANMAINFVFREDFRRTFRKTFFRWTNAVGITHHKAELTSRIQLTTITVSTHQ